MGQGKGSIQDIAEAMSAMATYYRDAHGVPASEPLRVMTSNPTAAAIAELLSMSEPLAGRPEREAS